MCCLFTLSGSAPSSGCSTSWPHTQESMKSWWGTENTSWVSSLYSMNSLTHGHVHNYSFHLNLCCRLISLCRYHLNCLDFSVTRMVELLTKHKFLGFDWSKSKTNLLSACFTHSLPNNSDRKVRPRTWAAQALVPCVLALNMYTSRRRARMFLLLRRELKVSVSWMCREYFRKRLGFILLKPIGILHPSKPNLTSSWAISS